MTQEAEILKNALHSNGRNTQCLGAAVAVMTVVAYSDHGNAG